MLGYTLKNVLTLIPHATDLVKSASIEQEWPLDSKSNCLATALGVAYRTSISKENVDEGLLTKVANAVEAYGIKDTVTKLIGEMINSQTSMLEKSASAPCKEEYLIKQAYFEGELTGLARLEDIVKQAENLYQEACSVGIEPRQSVKIYSGNCYLSKQAALDSLGARFYASGDDTFLKIAAALSNHDDVMSPSPRVKNLLDTVGMLDKKAGLTFKGFNFYKEVSLTKEAAVTAMNVNVAGRTYPLSKLMQTPPEYVNQYLGEGFMEEITDDPVSAKAMVESLPMDSQQVLAQILRNVG
jgi:hypothetical protein